MRARPDTVAFARRLRSALTRGEVILWQALRGSRLAGTRFRGQHPFGPYVLDFYCPSARLTVEVDGPVHEGEPQAEADASRDRYLASQGVTTLRIQSAEIVHDLQQVLGRISRAVHAGQAARRPVVYSQ